jgi:hypothetical protein
MVKLIKLSSNNSNGYFLNRFNESIEIKPKSKICLLNASMNFAENIIEIDDNNDTLSYALSTNATDRIDVVIPHGSYSVNDLIDTIQDEMNRSVPNTDQGLGAQFKVVINNSVLNIQLKSSSYRALEKDQIPQANMINIKRSNSGGRIYERVDPSLPGFFYSKDTFCGSYGILSVKYSPPTLGDAGPCMLGLTKGDGFLTVIEDNYDYAVGIYDNAGTLRYFTRAGGIRTNNTAVTVSINSNIMIKRQGGIMYLGYCPTDNTADFVSLQAYNIPQEDDRDALRVLGQITGPNTNTTVFRNCGWTNDPFVVLNASGQYVLPPIDDSLTTTLISPYVPNDEDNEGELGIVVAKKKADAKILEFPKPDLQRLLGYSHSKFLVKKTIDYNWIATEPFEEWERPTAVIIELNNLTLESYDQTTQKRRNIIAVIPNFLTVNEQLIYNSDYPVWIDINNAYPISMREFQISVRSFEDELVTFRSGCTLTILISD